ncbi:inorganic phosphate transporter [Candidatus Lokiarchaeum ossiferum]|uniref:inorganic phosphate transporter n=1 Tax=Candidatus Lokiarchaeum ossiferum TaxID=2951803 RepID=UPI00352C58BF
MDWLTYCLIIFAIILTFGIGAQDESMATVYGSGSLTLKFAIILGGILSFLGVIFLSSKVGETIGADLLGEDVDYNSNMIFAILAGTSFWLLIASKTSVPISTTHSVVGSVFGISFIWAIAEKKNYFSSINWINMGKITIGWVLSPLLGFLGAMMGQYIINRIMKNRNDSLLQVEKNETIFRYLIILFACVNQFSRGGNDSGNAIGIFYGLVRSSKIDVSQMNILIIVAGCAFALGLMLIGRNLIKNVGTTAGQLRPSEALAVEAATAIIILAATLLGLPVSGGHILIFALIGSARMKGEHPDKRSFKRMVISWIVTFPIAALFSATFYGIILFFT